MEMNTTRRMFLGGATALAVWAKDLFAAKAEDGRGRGGAMHTAMWEKPDGTARKVYKNK